METVDQDSKLVGKIKYFPKQILGNGLGSRVYKGLLDGGRNVAVKRISFETSDREKSRKEIEILLKCDRHENVVTYFATEILDDEFLFIALELCDLSLAQWIRKEELKEAFYIQKQNILEQVTKGLGYLHTLKIIHRDLKPDNILMVKLGPDIIRVKISDFGVSKQLADGQTSKTDNTGSGTREWMAPEILQLHMKGPATNAPKMSSATDIFALGCIFYYVLTSGRHPFGEDPITIPQNVVVKYKQCLELTKLECEHLGSARLIQIMIAEKPSDRPPASAILSHHLFWSKKKALDFLVSVSNTIEQKKLSCVKRAKNNYSQALYTPWMSHISKQVQLNLINSQYRPSGYNPNDVVDLVRAIRNLHNHYSKLPTTVQKELGAQPNGFMEYWIKRFPFLVDNIWTNFQKLKNKEQFGLGEYYAKDFDFCSNQQRHKLFDNFISQRLETNSDGAYHTKLTLSDIVIN